LYYLALEDITHSLSGKVSKALSLYAV